ncbi:MAG: hypothetical protein C5B58_04220 [Acidobacteria bacterium]|nr:MAG: hypothetical protein C5B58_04220 [Acidobacteriota bacterium]
MKKNVPLAITVLAALTMLVRLAAQEQQNESATTVTPNPVPWINQPLLPDAIRPGAVGFTLIVNGTGFVSGSVVEWNGTPRVTSYVNSSQLKAAILSTDITKAGTARVTVVNPNPTSTSNLAFLEVTRSTSSVALDTSYLRAGSNPAAVVAGDFNGDGTLDLAVANAGSNSVRVLLGNGDGTFKAALNSSVLGPGSLVVGDFNGDGKLDLAVTNTGVSILLGNGDGTLRAPVNYATGNSPTSVVVGDFNRDGKLDLAVANSGASNGVGSVSVLLGRGDGTFNPAVNYSGGFGSLSLAVGDFNRDGKLDLVEANFSTDNVTILLSNGNGTFQAPRSYGTNGAPTSVAVGDFNADGKLDLVVANLVNNSGGAGSIGVLLGNGDGTFQPVVNYGLGSNPDSVAVGDFNGDGKLDLAVANSGGYGNPASMKFFLGKGTGTFQPALEYVGAGSPNPSSLAVGDLNGHGRLDVAVADGSTVATLLQPPLVSGVNAFLPASLMFGTTQLVGTTSSVQPVQLNNYGTLPLSISSISAKGDFIQNHTCGSTLAAGAGCTIYVAFRPTQGGTRSGTLSVADDAPGSPQTLSLTGTGTVVELVPTSLRFGCEFQCHLILGCHCYCSGSETTTLTNVGRTTLNITDVTISGPFSLGNACPTSVGAGQSCALTVGWDRISGTGDISISDNGGASPQTVPLSGVKQCSP